MAKIASSLPVQLGVAAALSFGITYAISSGSISLDAIANEAVAQLASSGASGNCNIKGNVSIGTGERIYHVPGQRYYAETKVDSRYGEQWFCSEVDARAAGWRRSRV